MNKEVAQFQKELRLRGWSIQKTNGGHFRYTHPSGQFVFGSSTPSDSRSISNERARAERIERGLSQPPQKIEGQRREKKVRSRLSQGRMIEYETDPRDPWPNLPNMFHVEAHLQNSGNDIKIVLPGDFAGVRFFLKGEQDRRILELTLDPLGHEIVRGWGDDNAIALLSSRFLQKVKSQGYCVTVARRQGKHLAITTLLDYLSKDEPSTTKTYRAPRPNVAKPTPITTTRRLEEETMMTPQPILKLARTDDVEGDILLLKELIDEGRPMSTIADQLGYAAGQVIKTWVDKGNMPLVAWRLLHSQERPGSRPMSDEERIKAAFGTINDAVRHKNMKLSVKPDGTLGAVIVTEIAYG